MLLFPSIRVLPSLQFTETVSSGPDGYRDGLPTPMVQQLQHTEIIMLPSYWHVPKVCSFLYAGVTALHKPRHANPGKTVVVS